MGGSGVEQGRGGVCEVTVGHQEVRINGALNVTAMDADSNTHEHVLRALGDLAVDTKKV